MLNITSISVTPCQSAADAALAAAVERWLPHAEGHELQAIRDELRARGHDVLPLVRADVVNEMRDVMGALETILALHIAHHNHPFHAESRAILARAKEAAQ